MWSGQAAEDEVMQLLEWRDVEFQSMGLGATAGPSAGTTSGRPGHWLPFDRQKAIHEKHKKMWSEAPENQAKLKNLEKRHKGVNHKIIRDRNAMYRADCFEKMGGTDWLYILVAIGTLDDKIMKCMNEAGVDRFRLVG